MITNTLECLRHISCSEETPRYISDLLQTSVYDAWNQARDSVYQEWQYLTDPVNLQPRIRPLFRNLADHLRQYPPSDVTQDELDRTVEALGAPWGLRIERELGNTFNMIGTETYEKSKIKKEMVRKVLTPMKPNAEFKNKKILPLVCYWDAMHPLGDANEFFSVDINSENFSCLKVFSMSNHIRNLIKQDINFIEVNMTDAEERLSWLEKICIRN